MLKYCEPGHPPVMDVGGEEEEGCSYGILSPPPCGVFLLAGAFSLGSGWRGGESYHDCFVCGLIGLW